MVFYVEGRMYITGLQKKSLRKIFGAKKDVVSG
jgi:hypothetical protein